VFEIVMIDPGTHEEFILTTQNAEQQEFLLASLQRNGIRAHKKEV
jgi:hypothetical protein